MASACPPQTWHLSRSARLGIFLATRLEPEATGKAFRDRERVLEALAHGMIRIDDTVRVGGRVTTAGRYLVAECFPQAYRDDACAAPCSAERLDQLLSRVMRDLHVEIAGRSAEALELFGRSVADRSGLSATRSDFAPAPEKDAIVAEAFEAMGAALRKCQNGDITDGERYKTSVNLWSDATERTRFAAKKRAHGKDPLVALAAADPETPRPEHVRGLSDSVSRYPGSFVEAPVRHTLLEGLTSHEFMATCKRARFAALSLQRREAFAAILLERLHTVVGETTLTVRDCGTTRGVRVESLVQEFTTMVTLAARIEGRITAADVIAPDGPVLAPAGSLLTRAIADRIDAAGIPGVLLRDPLTCEAEDGVCVLCFGLDPDDATWSCPGDDVGLRAARTIARAARELSEPWIHIC
jgi:DNA-directed RNA polymerase subunit beta'